MPFQFEKHLSWERIRELNDVYIPWLIMVDLNEILYPFEKEGGSKTSPIHASFQRCPI
jgi:hypothetical protein